MVETYMAQLERLATAAGTTVEEIARAEGLPESTIWRWRQRGAEMTRDTAERLVKRLKAMPKPNGGSAPEQKAVRG